MTWRRALSVIVTGFLWLQVIMGVTNIIEGVFVAELFSRQHYLLVYAGIGKIAFARWNTRQARSWLKAPQEAS